MTYKAVVIGGSAGGFAALTSIVSPLSKKFPLTLIAVLHLKPSPFIDYTPMLRRLGSLSVSEAQEKQPIAPGTLYLAPPSYHLLVEPDETFGLTVEDQVNFSRPSIDVLFESAADVYGKNLIGILMTGANCDGALGMKAIKEAGGFTIAQDPKSAVARAMPESAIKMNCIDRVLSLDEIANFLLEFDYKEHKQNA